jgi:hypothetical protein
LVGYQPWLNIGSAQWLRFGSARTLLQLTYKDAYEKYGEAVGKDFLGSKRIQVATPKYGTDSAGWFWKEYKGVDLSEFANKNDFIYLTQKINGAFNGWDDRLMLLGRAAVSLLIDQCPNLQACPNLATYSVTHSECNNSKVATFAFGYWFDPGNKASRVVGVTKNAENALEGYRRFAELTTNASDRDRKRDGNFGFKTVQAMIDFASQRIDQIDTSK